MTSKTETVGTAVAKVGKPGTAALMETYRTDFGLVLPSHIRSDTWFRVAQSAMKKGKVITVERGPYQGIKMTELELAALNKPGVFLGALLEAARLGLEPGTEQYYLTPRKVAGQFEVLGIVGYQGYIELMYRAGAVSSVIVENVHQNDGFSYKPGRDEYPDHEIDWDASDRGPLRLCYAYARMKGGATSKVVVLNAGDVDRIRAKSGTAKSDYSPWKTDEPAMWLKSAARQLRKWVPTSAEIIRDPVRVSAERADQAGPTPALAADAAYPGASSYDSEVYEGELVAPSPEELTAWNAEAEGSAQ
jgi:recombination protein RecT